MITPDFLQVNRLHEVVDRLVKTLQAKTTGNQSFFVNEIPGHLQLGRDPQVIASVLGRLLSAVVSYAKDSSIQLSAKMYGNVILVRVKSSCGFNNNGIEKQLQTLLPLAERMRGAIGFTSQRNNITTICLGFSNLPL
jgi:K+-sensing histidine kinase KdpD